MPRFLSLISKHEGVRAGFIGRIEDVEVGLDKDEVVARLRPAHEAVVRDLGFSWPQLHLAQQVHGADIALVGKDDVEQTSMGVDGLITSDSGVLLGIYVADCGAVYIHDPARGVIALLHSGKKGTEGNITGRAIQMMEHEFGSSPLDMRVALSPCIRPPHYEIDFAAEIRRQVLSAGVPADQYSDAQICTASDITSYYSYRREKGKTGRMLALLGMV